MLVVAWIFKQSISFLEEMARCQEMCSPCHTEEEKMAECWRGMEGKPKINADIIRQRRIDALGRTGSMIILLSIGGNI